MMNFLQEILFGFKNCFSRVATFNWFVIVMTGFIMRTDHFGVTSIIRGLMINPKCYEKILHFFHSEAWSIDKVLHEWWNIILKSNTVVKKNGKVILLADHTKVSKEARKMPGVATLHQDSETSSKPSFFRGHFWGTISILTGNQETYFSTPMWSSIHQNLNLQGVKEKKIPSTKRIVKMATDIIEEKKISAYLVLDAFFAAGPVFNESGQIGNAGDLTVITPAKSNTVAYHPIDKKIKKRGAPRKYGTRVEVSKKFGYWGKRFKTAEVELYGKKEKIEFYSKILIWKPTKSKILFIWSKTSRGNIVLMCSDIKEEPTNIIELYCKRAKIETFFAVLKHKFGGHQYHFWSKYLEPNSRAPKKNKKTNKSTCPEKTKLTYECIHRFFNLQSIVIGIMQLTSIKFKTTVISKSRIWLRTPSKGKPSEFLAVTAMRNEINEHSIKLSENQGIDIIREKRKRPKIRRFFKKAA